MGPDFALLDLRRGAPFITTTRQQIISVLEELQRETRKPPLTIQLLGTVDDIVAPADNVDLATGGGSYYIEVPETNHLNVIEFGCRGA